MQCPRCASYQHKVVKTIRYDSFDERILLCEECGCEFKAVSSLLTISIYNPETMKKEWVDFPTYKKKYIKSHLGKALHPTMQERLFD